MMNILLMVRLLTMGLSGATIGYALVVLVRYAAHEGRKPHVFLIAISYIGWVLLAMFNTLDQIIHIEPFHWWSSPLALGAAFTGFVALTRYLPLQNK